MQLLERLAAGFLLYLVQLTNTKRIMEKRVLLPQTRREAKAYLSYMNIIDIIWNWDFKELTSKGFAVFFLQKYFAGYIKSK
jgi:hypothetical protein